MTPQPLAPNPLSLELAAGPLSSGDRERLDAIIEWCEGTETPEGVELSVHGRPVVAPWGTWVVQSPLGFGIASDKWTSQHLA